MQDKDKYYISYWEGQEIQQEDFKDEASYQSRLEDIAIYNIECTEGRITEGKIEIYDCGEISNWDDFTEEEKEEFYKAEQEYFEEYGRE